MTESTTPTIAAADWIQRATVDNEVHERWPDYAVVLVASDHIDPARIASAADELFDEAVATARSSDDDVDTHIARWHDVYRDFGVKPRLARVSVDALIRRARSDNGLPRINPIVDLYNAVSILHRVPIGGEDLDHYQGPPRLLIATGSEPFHTRVNAEPVVQHPDPGEPVWVDDGGVTCRRWNWRQTSRTAITATTRRAGFIIDSLGRPHHDAQLAAAAFTELFPDVVTRTITGPPSNRPAPC